MADLTEAESLENAKERGRKLHDRSVLATAAKYDGGRVHVELSNGCAIAFPPASAEALVGARAAELRKIEVWGAGTVLHWPALDADMHVPSLVRGVLGSKAWMAQLGAAGGKARSEKKVAAAQANGQRGGRPRKAASAGSPAQVDPAELSKA